MNNTPKVALVYDRVNSWGGAERVLLALHQIYPQAPLYTSVFEPSLASWAQGWDVRTSWLQFIPWARRRHRFFGWLMPWLFASFDLSAYDLIISVTSESAKNIRCHAHQRHVCYLLTPTRYLWSHSTEYKRQFPSWLQPLVEVIFHCLRKIDQKSARSADVMIPISQRVRKRALHYYQRPIAEPVYPPVSPLIKPESPSQPPPQKFMFSWGRHVPYKKFDQLIRAAVASRVNLVIAGSGPDTVRLISIANRIDAVGRYVQFVGQLSEGQLHWYLQRAQAAVFPQIEDFGIVIMEAQLAGCPVVAHRLSGASELLRHGSSGLLLADSKAITLRRALTAVSRRSWDRLDIKRSARQYAGAYFARQWRARLQQTKEEHGQ